MRNTLSRLFGLNEKAEDFGQQIDEKEKIQFLPINIIKPNPYQPRTIFHDQKINELAKTIETHGILQPIVARKMNDDTYEIIAGERRYRAALKLGLPEVPVIVKALSDKETAEIALIENLQREELTPVEEAIAYQKLLELHDMTQEMLAQQLGKGQSTIANKLRLLKLPEQVQNALLERKITERHARALIPLKDLEKQLKVLEEIIELQLNVKQTEDKVTKMLETRKEKVKPKMKSFSRDTRIAMNTIRESISLVTKTGLHIDSNEEEFDEFYQITIKIPKQ
ncbi:MAG: nucleoid occlusion protein [Bacillaceae bacterium]